MEAESDRIKDRLRACTTPQEVHEVADQERAAVRALAQTDKTQAIQIANLKAYRLAGMRGQHDT